jgi:HD-GYP domain-containing protein (c-di-GMP phosphodiesterase class II)
MFVLQPDCGWRETPFLLEGVLVQNQEEIKSFAAVARHVMVDLNRSSPESLSRLDLQNLAEDAVRTTAVTPSVAGVIAAEPDGRFKQYVSTSFRDDLAGSRPGFGARLHAWWRKTRSAFARSANLPVSRPMPRSARPSYIPGDINLVIYRDPEPTPIALRSVKTAFRQVEKTLEHVAQGINANGVSDSAAVKGAADTLVDNMILRPATMMWVAKLRANNNARYQQAVRVAVHLTALGRQIGFQKEQLADLASIGLLLDIGKINLPAELLGKPGPLDPAEAELMRGHVALGLEMFADSVGVSPVIIQAIAQHHERVDGTGYPKGLTGPDIGIYGKMAAIVDAFVAMTNPRSYAPTYTAYEAIRELFNDVDAGLYGPLVEQFVQAVGIFPVGSMVELATGEVAIVVQHNETRRLDPKILILTAQDKEVLDEPREIDMLTYKNSSEEPLRILRGLTEGTYGIDFRNYYLSQNRPGQ